MMLAEKLLSTEEAGPVKKALIVIDVQESFRQRPYWQASEFLAFLHNLQSLIDSAAPTPEMR